MKEDSLAISWRIRRVGIDQIRVWHELVKAENEGKENTRQFSECVSGGASAYPGGLPRVMGNERHTFYGTYNTITGDCNMLPVGA